MELTELQRATTHEGRVARLTIPGGELTARTAQELVATAEALIDDRDVRLVVLSAEAGDFCTGPSSDLDPLMIAPDPAAALARVRPPVIAVIAGQCLSVGFELALACDIRIGRGPARFGLPDLAAGRLPSWGGTQRLPRAVGHARAASMLLLGTELDVPSAEAAGLLFGTQPLEELVEELLGVGPLALELAKEAVHRGAELPLRDGLRLEGDLNHLLQATDDRAEGIAAFLDKRPPDFAGR